MKLIENGRWIWRYSSGFRGAMLWSSLLGVLYVIGSLAFVWLCKRFIDIATSPVKITTSVLVINISLLVGVTIFQQICANLQLRLTNYNSIKFTNTLHNRLFDTVMRSIWNGKEKLHTGDVVNRLNNDIKALSDLMCVTIPDIITTIIQFCAAFAFMLVLDSSLAWWLFLIMPLAVIVSKSFFMTIKRLTHNIRNSESEIQAFTQEHLQHRTLVSTMEGIGSATTKLSTIQSGLLSGVMRRTRYVIISRSVLRLGFTAGYIVAFTWGIVGINSGAITFGVMTAFLQLVGQIQRPVIDLTSHVATVAQTLTSAERLSELSMLEREDSDDSIKISGGIGIEFKNVEFTYPDSEGRKILENFSHNFEPEKLHTIVGESGAGKSTLVRLILALLRADNGSVTLYNSDSEFACSPMTRANITYIPQGNSLTSGTILDNLLLAKASASEEEIRSALHTAVADFVYQLPDGLQTMCGERGAGLSEGEAQRIAIARGLLRDGGVVILDEPTSALDPQSEMLLLERLKQRTENKTVIIVTHRENTAKFCDSVVELSKKL